MGRSRPVVLALAGLSLLLAAASLGFFVSHPSVEARSTGETFQCLATWDIVLDDAHNDPDGFPPLPGEYIGARCVTKAYRDFHVAVSIGAVAVGLGLVATFVWVRGRRTARRGSVSSGGPAEPR